MKTRAPKGKRDARKRRRNVVKCHNCSPDPAQTVGYGANFNFPKRLVKANKHKLFNGTHDKG